MATDDLAPQQTGTDAGVERLFGCIEFNTLTLSCDMLAAQ